MGRKWNNIKYAKAAKDANKSKIYAKFGKEIYMAAKSNPDPEGNLVLKAVLDKAKTYNVTKDIIDRALAKAKSGVDESYDNIRYEGYGPSGSAIIVDTLTDNVNRTVAEVRSAFTKAGGNLGVSGSVSFMFTSSSVFGIDNLDEETVLEAMIAYDADVSDIEVNDDILMIYGSSDDFAKIKEALQSLDIDEFKVAEISMLPNDSITLTGNDLEKFTKIIDTLEDLDDVQEVFHNVDLDN
ncbi:MAG: YebC/PmpR family DNA-binding transcriptional regulator [Bacilli bacterium]|nr:YebC/PmpR family DNA-binding transcriptional regulator [Bacilli bacterium]